MMRYAMRARSRFRLALLAPALAACAGSEERVRTVAPEEYTSRFCWFDAGGEFTAFLVVARREGVANVYPISGKCLVEPGQRSLGLATVRQVGIVDLVDNHGALRRAFPGFVDNAIIISDSTITDQPHRSHSRIYYFRARVTSVRLPNGIAYAPEQILQLDDANITFQRFLELTAAERERLWRARRSPS